ncbi:serine hydrolase [Roseobacter sp.]|uniref:serine hydrolase domain-containing protein n=1 Tax=Roseobacter sp. TaxID=1907202 RepID=UPI0025EA645D|nr:serine hydrolase [Roseobacter sp.]
MRRAGKWLGRVLLMLICALVAAGVWKRDEINRLMAVNSLFDPDRIVANFSNMDAAFLHTRLETKTVPVSPLPTGAAATMPDGFDAFVEARRVTSVVVLHDGRLVYESYHLGTGRDDLRISWSVAKSFMSALTGVILAEGAIRSLDDPVVQYAPSLAGGAYDKATVRHVLNMATGVTFDEDYLDKSSDINRMGRILALGGRMDDFAAGLTETFAEPGIDWQYVSIDTHVLGMVLRGATGRSLSDLMQEKIIMPLGPERAPYYLTDGAGVAFALGGLNLTTRDYARFGLMFAQGGLWQGKQVVPAAWAEVSTTPSAPTQPDEMGYGYQWWMPRDARPREYMGRGIYGQYLYISEPEGVVIALTAVDPAFRRRDIVRENIAMFRRIADSF